ncbi:MAG TPA: hypothetical protein VJV79_13120 [Polyangiaceae bacterium]|nr:hypothetical protein [Polyangiaceae bacterium]
MSQNDPVRLVVVTGGLALAGAMVGALAGATALATVMVLSSDVARSSDLLAIAGQVGAFLGSISAPLVIWVMLPRVPLGYAFLRLTLSTIVSGVLGWFAFSSLDMILGPTIAAFVGFIASAVVLSLRYERTPALTAGSFRRLKASKAP